ncbi:MAG: hypothetical protein ACK4N5_06450 [Myxococcales bacterium]
MDALTFKLSLDEMKLVYRVLHAQLASNLELMDSSFFGALQSALQQQAKLEGVDATDHAAWDRWLGNDAAPGCAERVGGRTTLQH